MELELRLPVEDLESPALERLVVDLAAELEREEGVAFACGVSEPLLERVPRRRMMGERRIKFAVDVVCDPVDGFLGERQPPKVTKELLFEGGLGQAGVRAGATVGPRSAAVVDIPPTRWFGVDLRDQRPPAEVAGEHPGIGEVVVHWSRAAGTAEYLLCPIELVHGHHRGVGATVALARLQTNESGVVRVGEELEHPLERERLPAELGGLAGLQPPLLVSSAGDLHRPHLAREQRVPHPSNKGEPLGILDHGLRRSILEVADRRSEVGPALLEAGPIPAEDIGAQVIDELGGDAELEVAEEAVVAVGGVGPLRRNHLFKLLVGEGLKDLP